MHMSKMALLAVFVSAAMVFSQTPIKDASYAGSAEGLTLSRRFVKVMYPALKGSDLRITYTLTGDRLDLPEPAYGLQFIVQKFCYPPAGAKVALVGNMYRPCGEYDKNYTDPLSGEFAFRRDSGRLLLFRGTFGGAMVRVPGKGRATVGGVCTEQNFIAKDALLRSIPRTALQPLLGGVVSIEGVDPQDPYGADYGEWRVRLVATSKRKRVHYYAFNFDACGTLHSFSNTH
jgi:hypothetical protein